MLFAIKRLQKLENLAQKVPHVAIYYNIAAIIQVFKGGKLSSEETIQGRKLLIIRSF